MWKKAGREMNLYEAKWITETMAEQEKDETIREALKEAARCVEKVLTMRRLVGKAEGKETE